MGDQDYHPQANTTAFKPLRDVLQKPQDSTSVALRQSPSCPSDLAATRARILVGCYRRGDAEDPEIYAAAVAAVLASYPREVAEHVTDPRSGLAANSQWLPTVAEVKAACETRMVPLYAAERRRRQQEERDEVLGSFTKPERRETPERVKEVLRDLSGDPA